MNQPKDNFIGRWSRRKKENQQTAPHAAEEQIGVDTADAGAVPELIAEANAEATLAESDVSTPNSAGFNSAGSRNAGSNNAEATTAGANNPNAVNPDAATEQSPAEPTDEDMVALDTLDADSDYSPFMSEGVSSELRKAALKKLFFSGKFGTRDGLDDYDEDFTYFEPLGDTVTSDMKYHARRKEKERLAKLEEEERLALEAQSETDEGSAEITETDISDTDNTLQEDVEAKGNSDSEQPPLPAQDIERESDRPEVPVNPAKNGEIQISSAISEKQPQQKPNRDSGTSS